MKFTAKNGVTCSANRPVVVKVRREGGREGGKEGGWEGGKEGGWEGGMLIRQLAHDCECKGGREGRREGGKMVVRERRKC